jgi:hypothetical protein
MVLADFEVARLEQAAHTLNGVQLSAPHASIPTLPSVLAQPDTPAQTALLGGEQGLALLEAKLSHAHQPTALVARERLQQQLDAALEYPLTSAFCIRWLRQDNLVEHVVLPLSIVDNSGLCGRPYARGT